MKRQDLKALNREQIRQMLQRLVTAGPPVPKMQAMCYSIPPPPEQMEYICPACGEKTLYHGQQAYPLDQEVRPCRRLVQELASSAVTLDESQWCRKCRPGVTEPVLTLRLFYDDGTTRAIPGITSEALRLLCDFLRGRLVSKGALTRETPLQEILAALETLLGEKAK